jgi:hypothetical protein
VSAATVRGPAPAAGDARRRGTASPRRLAVAAGVALAVTVIAWLTGDWWAGDAPGAGRNRTIARALLFGTLLGAVYAAPAMRRASLVAVVVFAAWALYLGAWLVALWPGIVMTDTVDAVVNARQGIVYEWFSYVHSLVHLMALDVVPHVATLGVVQVLATAALMAYASRLVLRAGGRWPAVVAMNLLAAICAPLIVNTLLYSRDTLYGIAHVFLALAVAEAVVVRRSLSRGGLLGIAALTGLLSVYRGDGIALALVVPALLLLLRPDRRRLLHGAAAFAGSLAFFHVLLPAATVIDPKIPGAYALSLRLNPLGAVLNTNFYSADKERDLAALSRVIDVEAVRREATPTEIPAYWNGRWNREADSADFEAFTTTADRLLRDNLATVLGNRVQTFGAASGLAEGGFKGTDFGPFETRHGWIADRTGMEGAPPSSEIYDAVTGPLRESGRYYGLLSWRSSLQWNLIPWMLLLGGVLLAYRRLRFEAVVAAVILCRVPLVFAAAPAAQYKYYYSVLLGGLVVLGLLLGRAVARR